MTMENENDDKKNGNKELTTYNLPWNNPLHQKTKNLTEEEDLDKYITDNLGSTDTDDHSQHQPGDKPNMYMIMKIIIEACESNQQIAAIIDEMFTTVNDYEIKLKEGMLEPLILNGKAINNEWRLKIINFFSDACKVFNYIHEQSK